MVADTPAMHCLTDQYRLQNDLADQNRLGHASHIGIRLQHNKLAVYDTLANLTNGNKLGHFGMQMISIAFGTSTFN